MSGPVVSPDAYAALARAGYVKDGKVVALTPGQAALLRMKEWLKARGKK